MPRSIHQMRSAFILGSGPDHPVVAPWLNYLANLYQTQGPLSDDGSHFGGREGFSVRSFLTNLRHSSARKMRSAWDFITV
jgi:hypothetical protein